MLGLRHALHANPALTPFIVLLLVSSVFGALLGGAFLSPFALSLLLQQVAVVGVVGAAQTLVVLTAGIDLSVGAIMVLCSVVMGQLVFRFGLPASFAVVCGLAVGMLIGFINGLLVARGRLPPFIVTLGTWQAVLATNFLFSRNETIRSQEIEAGAPLLQLFGLPLEAGGAVLTLGTIAMLTVVLVLHYVLEHTAWGRHVLAVGDDPAAAELAGVDVQRTLLSVYVLAGLICAFAGWVMIGRIGSVSPTSGQTVNIESITAVVIGGISLFGGRGSILGMLFGALTVGALGLGLRLAGTDPQWTYLLIGVFMIAAVTLDVADFDLLPGEILAIVGDNGAGKSTLIKALSGAVVADEGEVRLDGRLARFASPREARAAGIETVYQTLALSPALSIADNLFMGRELRKAGVLGRWLRALDRNAMERLAREKLAELGLQTVQDIRPRDETLSGGQRHAVAVARAAAFGSKVIILDEPTAALGITESRRVLDLMLAVRARGLAIVLVSHNMPHVFEVADRIHVQRLGRRICVVDPKRHAMADVVAFMTGAMEPPAGAPI